MYRMLELLYQKNFRIVASKTTERPTQLILVGACTNVDAGICVHRGRRYNTGVLGLSLIGSLVWHGN
jgi:hypothetical protein